MSASGLPYHLRPRKFVDRELFSEFVAQLLSSEDSENYVYISMGGKHLSDHRSLYRRTAIQCLYSFDGNQDIVAHQNYFKPFDGVCCEELYSNELAGKIDSILGRFSKTNAIIWLDYTASISATQLDEVSTLIGKLRPGDVLRVTVNLQAKDRDQMESVLPLAQRTMAELTADYIRNITGSYLRETTKEVAASRIDLALSECLEAAFVRGLSQTSYVPIPVLLTKYTDSTTMFVATVLIQEGEQPQVPLGWRFVPSDWQDILLIDLPDLTPSERYRFDPVMHHTVEEISAILGFNFVNADELDRYRRFHRFYPIFESVAS